MRAMLRLLAAPVVFLALVAACLAWSLDGTTTRADFTFINRGDHKTLDLGNMSWLQDIRVAYALWEGLYTLDPVTCEPIPGVATRVDVDPAGLIYTFHLRPDARWSNGDGVSGRDFVFAWRRMLEQPAEYTSLFFYIKGARDYDEAYAAWVERAHAGAGVTREPPPDFFARVGIRLIDSLTLRVTLENPTPFFLSLTAFPSFFPQHEPSMAPFAIIDDHTGRVASYDESFTRPPSLVSNGPYELTSWEFKRKLRYTANRYYWNATAVQSKTIDEPIIEDPMAALRAYLSGQVDWYSDVDNRLVGEMLTHGGRSDLHTCGAFGTYYYALNCEATFHDGRVNPLADVRVRRALAMAIDKRPIVENVTRSGEPITTDFVPRGAFAHYESPTGIAYDPEAAQRLLAEAGYPGGRGFPRISILFNKEGPHGDIALIIRSQWLKTLGISVDTNQTEVKIFGARLHERDFDIARASWFGDYDDPTTFTDKFRSDNDDNNPGWKNAPYDALCDEANKETEPVARMKLLSQAEAILLDEAAIVPLFQYVNGHMFRENVKGLPVNSRDLVMLDAVKVVR